VFARSHWLWVARYIRIRSRKWWTVRPSVSIGTLMSGRENCRSIAVAKLILQRLVFQLFRRSMLTHTINAP
jgi:hypothetical protein